MVPMDDEVQKLADAVALTNRRAFIWQWVLAACGFSGVNILLPDI